MEKEFTRDYTEGKITLPLVRFALPLFLANILQIFYNMVDMIVVGHVEGQAGLSAVSIGGEITMLFTVLVMGFSNAAQIIISQYVGARQKDKIGRFIGTLVLTLLAAAIVCTVLALMMRKQMLDWMNTPQEAYEQALGYSVMSMSGIIFVFGYNAVSAIMRGLGDSKRPFLFVTIASVLNMLLDVAFVVGLKMGAFGAALATVISQAISFLCAIIYLFRNKERLGFELSRKDLRMDWGMFKTLIKLGIPLALRSAAVIFSRLFTNSFVYSYGLAVTAVTGIGSKINMIGNLVSMSLQTAGATMVGQNIGGQKYSRVWKIMISVWTINLALTLPLIAAIILFPEQIFMLFTSDISIMDVVREFVPIAAIMLSACVLRSGAGSLTIGSGNFMVNFAVALIDALIARIGLALLFGIVFDMGYRGFWLGDAISGTMPFFIGIVFLLSGRWKTRKHIIKE
ncbi:MAG: MATE family efflux transporter [Lachnospiraceae bacterium]|jgi:putative MATE family efflux protein